MRYILPTISFVGFFWLASSAFADPSLSEQTEKLEKYGGMGDVEMHCEHKFDVSIDTESFSKVAKKKPDRVKTLHLHCKRPIEAVRHWCSMGYKDVVKKQISSYVCRYGSGESKMTLENGVLTMITNWKNDKTEWSKKSVGNVLNEGGFSLSQAALIRHDSGRITSAMLDMKRRCKHDVKWKVDWKSFDEELDKRVVDGTHSNAIWQYCLAPLTALEGLCNNDQAKLMKDQVSSFVCRYDKQTDAKMTLKGKVLILRSNLSKDSGLNNWAKNLVEDTLRDGDFSVRQAGFMRAENANFKRLYSESVNNKCKTKIDWSIDWKSFEGEVDKRLSGESKTSIYAACGVPLDRLTDVCGSDRKNKITKKISSFNCKMGTKKLKLGLKKGKLQFHVDFAAKDPYGAVDTFLVKNRVIKKKPQPKKLSPRELSKIRQILGEGAEVQKCYKECARSSKKARAKQKCRNRCQ